MTPAEIASKAKGDTKVWGVLENPTWKCALKQKRKQLNLTLLDVEKGCGVNITNLSRIERGSELCLSTAKSIAKFFGCSVEELWPEKA
jgi:DNA-binding XRE family transcriptional regulator